MSNSKLSIIVPAYKPFLLEQTIRSILAQSCNDFQLLVVDDASPYPIHEIIRKFDNIKYFRFDSNLGGQNLVAHWDRCVQLVDSEFVWLFSDDDFMDPECVEAFYKIIRTGSTHDVYRFNTKIDYLSSSTIINNNEHPEIEDSYDFLLQKILRNRNSYMPEYIFRRQTFIDNGGHFVNFPLAWNSDDASWALFAKKNGIRTIPGPKVTWRFGGGNISSQIRDYHLKMWADIQYSNWVRIHFNISDGTLRLMRIWRMKNDYWIPLEALVSMRWWNLFKAISNFERLFFIFSTIYPSRLKMKLRTLRKFFRNMSK